MADKRNWTEEAEKSINIFYDDGDTLYLKLAVAESLLALNEKIKAQTDELKRLGEYVERIGRLGLPNA